MKYDHHTCVIVVGDGRISVWHMDLYSLMGRPIHISGGPWWWGLMLRATAKG